MTAHQFAKHRETFCLASVGSEAEFHAYLSGFDAAVAIADLAAVPAQVRVKPLVWHKENERCWSAHWGFATYSVYLRDDGQYSMRMSWSLLMTDGYFDALESAKAAAQADYEARILAAIEPQPDPRDEHFDDYAVRSFAKMMAAKMAASRAKGRGGWSDPKQCSVEYLRRLLYTHLDKGDPVDVANICMMLRHYEASTAHEYESSAMAAACASRDEVIARLVEALGSVIGQCSIDREIIADAIAAAKAVQHG